MPSGKTHEKINKMVLHGAIFIALHMVSYLQFGRIGLVSSLLFVGGYLFGTYYFGPDLDIKSRPFYRWKRARFLWIPYQKLFAHRSFWTHGLFISDFIRVGYLLCWLLLPYGILYLVAHARWQAFHLFLTNVIPLHMWEMGCVLFGIVMASTLHILADRLGSFLKKRKRKRRSR